MKNLLICAVFLGLSSQCFAKAYFATKEEMIQKADTIVIVTITSVEKVEKETKGWSCRQKAVATVEQTLKGEAKGEIIIYGKESFICAQCHYDTGRYMLFLRKQDDYYTGSNWQNGIRPITGDKIQWYIDNNDRHTTKPLSLEKVIAEIHTTLNPPEPKPIKCKTGELREAAAAAVTVDTVPQVVFTCKVCGHDYKICGSCGNGPQGHTKFNHIPVHQGCK